MSTRLVIDSDPLAVREALRHLLGGPPLCTLTEDARGTTEIVLAEALNNVVEHAYARSRGPIEVEVQLTADALDCHIFDRGLPLPGNRLPGREPRHSAETLPEGGFGWQLIRALATELDYRRVDGVNHLSFRLCTAQSAD